jgi:ornithine cyclodeaminase/alanine dehydrogenase-like protein (mu-crystallin family)
MRVLLLNEDDVRRLLTMAEALEAVEQGLRKLALEEAENIPRGRARTDHAVLHIMGAAAKTLGYMGAKVYSSHKKNAAQFVVPLFDGKSGALVCLMQADYLGQLRTGAASGVATKYMARPDATEVGIFGSGKQARTQLEAVCHVRRVRQAHVYSRSEQNRRRFAEEMSARCGVEVVAADRPELAAEKKDIICTATDSREPVLFARWICPGAHVNAVGSNHLARVELDPGVLGRCATVVVDSKDQARVEAGDFQQPLEDGTLRWENVRELGQVIVGRHPARRRPDDVTLFKSLGIGIEDVAVAARVYTKAQAEGVGRWIDW